MTTARHTLAQRSAFSLGLLAACTLASAQLPPPPVSPAPVVKHEYNAGGSPTRTTQAPGVPGFDLKTSRTYDALERIKDSTDPKLGKTQFGYDGQDNLTQVTDPRGLITQYPRNGLGDATQLISPDTGTAGHTYDAAGNLKTRTDSRGVKATYTYDALNRLTKLVYSKSGQPNQAFTWTYASPGLDGSGLITTASHPEGSSAYSYDAHDSPLTATQTIKPTAGANAATEKLTVGYGYDANGRLTSLTYPSGRKLHIGYADGRIVSLGLARLDGQAPAMLIDQIQYQPFGALRSWQWHLAAGPQADERYFDAYGRLVRYRLGAVVRDLTYDAADRITGYTHYDAVSGAPQSALDQAFSYDENGRLVTIAANGSSWALGYDANGNRTAVTLNGNARSYATQATSNRLQSLSNPARSFSYDSAGNTLSDSDGYGALYDLSGRLTSLSMGGTTTTYSYDADGRRVRKFSSTGAASTLLYAYDQTGQLLGEYDHNGKAIREYVWLGMAPIAMFGPNPSAGKPAQATPLVYFLHSDHIATPRIAVDKAGKTRWRWMAEPFGTSAPETDPSGLGPITMNLRFPGQYADAESGLNYNYFRSYDASIGRYTQSDPIGLAGGINTYAYVSGNPLGYVDPLGLSENDLRFIMKQVQQAIPQIQPNGNVVVGNVPAHASGQTSRISGQITMPGNYAAERCLTFHQWWSAFATLLHEGMHSTDPLYKRLFMSDKHHQGIHNREAYEMLRPSGPPPTPIWGTPSPTPINLNALYAQYLQNSPDCACAGKTG